MSDSHEIGRIEFGSGNVPINRAAPYPLPHDMDAIAMNALAIQAAQAQAGSLLTEQQRKCLSGEHEKDTGYNYPVVPRFFENSPTLLICRYCQSLYPEKP